MVPLITLLKLLLYIILNTHINKASATWLGLTTNITNTGGG